MSDDDLEPIVLAHIEDGELVGISRDNGDSWTTQSITSLSCDPEPLVRLSAIIERNRERLNQTDTVDTDDLSNEEVEAFHRGYRTALKRLNRELEEFTQKGGTE